MNDISKIASGENVSKDDDDNNKQFNNGWKKSISINNRLICNFSNSIPIDDVIDEDDIVPPLVQHIGEYLVKKNCKEI